MTVFEHTKTLARKTYAIYASRQFLKNLASGGIVFCVVIFLTYLFTDIARLHYLLSSSLAFLIGLAVNFSLQKFWVFGERNMDFAYEQSKKFLFVALGNFIANYLSMFLLVGIFGLWYLGSQVFVIGVLSFLNFIAYRSFIFRR